MSAMLTLSFENGMLVRSRCASVALRMRVSMSAIGSFVIAANPSLLPARLRHAGDVACERKLAKADPAQLELAVVGPRSTTDPTAVLVADLELGLAIQLRECL